MHPHSLIWASLYPCEISYLLTYVGRTYVRILVLLTLAQVPPLVRPCTTGFVSMCFAMYISYMTHLAPDPAPDLGPDPPSDLASDLAADRVPDLAHKMLGVTEKLGAGEEMGAEVGTEAGARAGPKGGVGAAEARSEGDTGSCTSVEAKADRVPEPAAH